jgi:hypothetical protein
MNIGRDLPTASLAREIDIAHVMRHSLSSSA